VEAAPPARTTGPVLFKIFFGFYSRSERCLRVEWNVSRTKKLEGIVEIGGTVTITEGPLAGLAGRLASLSAQRALIVVQLRGREVAVEMDLDWMSQTAPQRKSITRVDDSEISLRHRDQA
jgi:hypothetical protein